MPEQTKIQLKEEFEKKFELDTFGEPNLYKDITDFWLSKIDELLKSQREELVEKLEEYKLNYNPIGNDINKGRRLACDDILYLIKQSK